MRLLRAQADVHAARNEPRRARALREEASHLASLFPDTTEKEPTP
jgi:hypothetical protein